MGSARIEVTLETGQRASVELTPHFLDRMRFIVEDQDAGYADLCDFVRSALRAEVDKAEKGIYGRRRKW